MSPTFTFATLVCVVIAALNPINSTLSRTALLASLTLATLTLSAASTPTQNAHQPSVIMT